MSTLILPISKCNCIFSLSLWGSFSEEEITLLLFKAKGLSTLPLVVILSYSFSALGFFSVDPFKFFFFQVSAVASLSLPPKHFPQNPISINPNCSEYWQMKYFRMNFSSSHGNSLLSCPYHISLHFVYHCYSALTERWNMSLSSIRLNIP